MSQILSLTKTFMRKHTEYQILVPNRMRERLSPDNTDNTDDIENLTNDLSNNSLELNVSAHSEDGLTDETPADEAPDQANQPQNNQQSRSPGRSLGHQASQAPSSTTRTRVASPLATPIAKRTRNRRK